MSRTTPKMFLCGGLIAALVFVTACAAEPQPNALITEDDAIELLLTKEIMSQLGVWEVRYVVVVASDRGGENELAVVFTSAEADDQSRADMQKDDVRQLIEGIVRSFLKVRNLTFKKVVCRYS